MGDKVYWLMYRLATVDLCNDKWINTQSRHVILFVASIYSARPAYIMSPDMFTESLIHYQVFRHDGEQVHTGKRAKSFEIDIMTLAFSSKSEVFTMTPHRNFKRSFLFYNDAMYLIYRTVLYTYCCDLIFILHMIYVCMILWHALSEMKK